MNSINVLNWHMRVFKLTGLSPTNSSILYTIWTHFCILTIFTGYPLSQLIAVFYVDSVSAAVDHLVMTSTVVMAAIKGLNVLVKRKTLIELFNLMADLDVTVTTEQHETVFKHKFIESDRLFLLFCVNYVGSWICVGFQTLLSEPEHRLYSSTYYFSNEFLNQRNIYVGVMIYQAIANFVMVFVDIAVDTYGASLLHVVGGHIDVLNQQLEHFCKNCTKSDDYLHQKIIFVEICDKYLKIIKYSKLLEEILSFTLFTQFGVSGLVLCTCAYQLSEVNIFKFVFDFENDLKNFPQINPSDDLHTFLFSIVYSFAMVTEIFVPSYFGSLVLAKSMKLTYAIFKSNWIHAPNQFKRELQIFAERTMRPITIFAASVFILNLATLLKVSVC